MGTIDEIKRSFGEDFFTRPTPATLNRHNWHEVCTCGHTDRYHSTTVGGLYVLPEPVQKIVRGETWTMTVAFTGCAGALPPRGFEIETASADRTAMVNTTTRHPTCPCDSFRPIVNVDRPNRYFNQRIPVDRNDRLRHPFMVGIRAFTTHLSRRRAALADPNWPAAEFERRFTWIDGARVCSISKCSETVDVWPVFVDGTRSELRCPKHP